MTKDYQTLKNNQTLQTKRHYKDDDIIVNPYFNLSKTMQLRNVKPAKGGACKRRIMQPSVIQTLPKIKNSAIAKPTHLSPRGELNKHPPLLANNVTRVCPQIERKQTEAWKDMLLGDDSPFVSTLIRARCVCVCLCRTLCIWADVI